MTRWTRTRGRGVSRSVLVGWIALCGVVGCTPFEAEREPVAVTPERAPALEPELAGEVERGAPLVVAETDPAPASASVDPPARALRGEDFWPGNRLLEPEQLERQNALVQRSLESIAREDPQRPELVFRVANNFRALRMRREDAAAAAAAVTLLETVVHDPRSRYPRMDEALFVYGAELGYLGRDQEMREAYKRLILHHPASAVVPHVYLAFADHYYAQRAFVQAARMYEKVLQLNAPALLGYVSLQLARCHLHPLTSGEPDYVRSLELYARAIKAASTGRAIPGALASRLRQRARAELTFPYARVGKPAKAPAFFARVGVGPEGEDDSKDMMESLARHYEDAGLYVESSSIYRSLQARYPDDPAGCAWTWGIYANARAGGQAPAVTEARERLERLARSARWRGDPACAAWAREASHDRELR